MSAAANALLRKHESRAHSTLRFATASVAFMKKGASFFLRQGRDSIGGYYVVWQNKSLQN